MYQISVRILLLLSVLFFTGCGSGTISSYSGIIFERTTPGKSYENSSPKHLQAVHRATFNPYNVFGIRYCPHTVQSGDIMAGTASWYGPDFHGKKTSSGEIYNKYDLTAAHKTWPMHTVVKVDNLENGKVVVVRINDRGPFLKNRIIDLSYSAAKKIAMDKKGLAKVKITVIKTDAKNWPRNAPDGISTGVTKSECFADSTKRVQKSDKIIKSKTLYLVQVASFSRFESAVRFQQNKLELPLSLASKVEEGNGMYRVLIGGFKDEAAARAFIDSSRYSGAFLVREIQ